MGKVTVSRIMGESFDLLTGDTIPKAVVLSNGADEIPIYVDDETALAILAMAHSGVQQELPLEAKPKKRQKKPKEEQRLAVVDELEAYRDASTGAPSR